METGTTCPRRFQYFFCGRRRGAAERVALEFGKRIHKVLAARYLHNVNVTEQTNAVMVSAASNAFADFDPGPDEYRNYGFAIEVINTYNKEYPTEGFDVVILPDGKPAIEVPFAVPIGEIPVNKEVLVRRPSGEVGMRFVKSIKIMWCGRVDLIYQRDSRLYLMDHKTTTQLGSTYFKAFEISHQVYGYVWAIAKLLNKAIYGFCINAIAVRKQTKTGKGIECIRSIVPLDQSLVDEWIEDTLFTVADLVEMAIRGYFPKHTAWCCEKFGTCQYFPVCSLPPHSREVMLMSGNYTHVDWDPLHGD
jgi:hypothetical protein